MLPGSSLPPASCAEDLADGLEAAVLDLGDELRFFERHAGNVVVLARVVADFAEIRFEQLRHQALARAAAQAGLGAGADLGDALAALGLNRLDDLPLADAVAVADLRVVGQVRRLEQRDARRRSEEQIGAARRHLGPGHEHLHERAGGFDLAEQDRAGDLVVADDQLLVDAARRLAIDDHFVVRRRAAWSRPSRPVRRP